MTGACPPRLPPHQRGVALLTVLLLVAVMAVLVMSVLDDIRFGLRRASNAQAVAQAQRYALGAEVLARSRIRHLVEPGSGRTTLAGDWDGRPFTLPVDNGFIRLRLTDATRCFNLNSVVDGAVEQWQRRELGARQFIALLQALDIPGHQAEALADALVDWIDSDGIAGTRGAEDTTYAVRRPAYRTAGALLAEPSELRAIQSFDATVYARLRPHVCALPIAALSSLNLNTLRPGDAALLVMLTDGGVSVEAARRLLESRPVAGWTDTAVFWEQPSFAGMDIPDAVRAQLTLQTRYFGLDAQVEYTGAQVVLNALFEPSPGDARLVARRWSPLE